MGEFFLLLCAMLCMLWQRVRSCKFCYSGKGEVHQIDSFKILATKVSSYVCIFPVDNSLTVVVDSG